MNVRSRKVWLTQMLLFASFGNDLVRAIIEERGFEYAGEGDRRWTLIRSGYLPEDIKRIKDND